MVNYSIKVQDQDGNNIGEFVNYRGLKFGKRLNNYGTCEFQIPVNDDRLEILIALRRYSVYIYREENGAQQLIWSGEQAMRSGSLSPDGNNWATIYCFDWLEQLSQRYTAAVLTFDQVDAGQIAWELINGAFGITYGLIEPTVLRDRTYYNQNVMEAIVNLSNVISGFDFEITNQKVFNVQSTIGVDRSEDVILEYGYNVSAANVEEDFSKPVNRAIVVGEATGEDNLVRVEVDDVALQSLYELREGLLSEFDISELATYQEKGEAMIQKYGLPLLKVDLDLVRSVRPTIADFSIGDLIRIKIQSGIYNINDIYRVFEWTVEYNVDDTEKISLVLGNFTES